MSAGIWFVGGLPGSGKTTVGRLAALLSGRRHVDLDMHLGLDGIRRIVEQEGEAGLRRAEASALRGLTQPGGPPLVMSLGGGTLCHAASLELVLGAGILAWIDVPAEICRARLAAAGPGRPLHEAAQALGAAAVAAMLADRARARAVAQVLVDGGGAPDAVARALVEGLLAWERGPGRPGA